MNRRPVVAGRRGKSSSGRETAHSGRKSKFGSRTVVVTGIVIPLAGIVAAFLPEPVYDAWKEYQLSAEPPIKAEVRWMEPHSAAGVMFPDGVPERDGKPTLEGNVADYPEKGGVVVKRNDGGEGSSSHQVQLVGNREETVRIRDVRARVLERRPVPPQADFVSWIYQGGGAVDELAVNLDDPSGELTSESSDHRFLDENFRYLEKGEPFAFQVSSHTQECWCTWELVADVAYGDSEETVVIRSDGTSDGSPFHTMFWPAGRADMKRFAHEYELAYPSGQLVDCGAARQGDPAALEVLEGQTACDLAP